MQSHVWKSWTKLPWGAWPTQPGVTWPPWTLSSVGSQLRRWSRWVWPLPHSLHPVFLQRCCSAAVFSTPLFACRRAVENSHLCSSGSILMRSSAFLKMGIGRPTSPAHQYELMFSFLTRNHLGSAVQPPPWLNPHLLPPPWQNGTRYDGQTVVFGSAFQEKLAEQKYFLVRRASVFRPTVGALCGPNAAGCLFGVYDDP